MQGWGVQILDTEDTAYSCIFILSWIHFQTFLLGEQLSEVSKDADNHVSVSHLKYIYEVSSPTLSTSILFNLTLGLG